MIKIFLKLTYSIFNINLIKNIKNDIYTLKK